MDIDGRKVAISGERVGLDELSNSQARLDPI
jgi:hypothetical protein